ncbi:MAG: DUF2927 domain-containing protein [Planktotalea sp.]|uniref:DUF2927 domain-containing protein n=1 Tax=Planktotalea sp. TaxID=2029877 RepID=UPI003C7270C2
MKRVRRILSLTALLGAFALAGCDVDAPPPTHSPAVSPRPTPKPIAPKPVPQAQSAQSKELATYYGRVQADLLVQGLLRTDGGGPDTPYTDTMLARNFEQIAFYDEYSGGGLNASNGQAGRLKRWDGPVRFNVEFGSNFTPSQQARYYENVASYAARLSRATGHPIGASPSSGNFHVLFMGEDDRALVQERVRALVPRIDPSALRIFADLPRSIHCLVVAFSGGQGTYGYTQAVALIRSEHPDLMMRSCIHEELAQGLGLANDSPAARPSIFNDDDEFALLTTHDAHLLGMLYDRRLQTGMNLNAARPIIRQIAAERLGAGF